MKLIKTKNGFVNTDMIESFFIIERGSSCDIVAYTPSCGGGCNSQLLDECKDAVEARACLKALTKWLMDGKSKMLDIMDMGE